MPTPTPGETRQEFVSRCIPVVLEDGTAQSQDQAIAVCNSMWEQEEEEMGKGNDRPSEFKVVPFDVSNLDFEGRTVEGYASVFGNVDEGGDIVHSGAFRKTLSERGDKVKFLWQHNPTEPLGRPLEMREDAHGLFVKAVVSDTAQGRDTLALLKDGAIDGMSIGYDAVKGGTEIDADGVRHLKEIKLWEFSLVTFPMNLAATVTALKQDDDKGVAGKTNWPLASRDRAWDNAAAQKRIRSWAGADEEPNAKYRSCHFWYDSANADNFTAYKLLFCDVVGGEARAVPRGIFAVAGALRGARTPLAIPAGDQAKIKTRVDTYYARMRREFDDDSIVAPWEKAGGDPDEIKVGRAISARNAERIGGAIRELIGLLRDAGVEIDTVPQGEGGEEEEEEGKSINAQVSANVETETGPDGEPPIPGSGDSGTGPGVDPSILQKLAEDAERGIRELKLMEVERGLQWNGR